jgi:hypothetical protein
MRKERVQQKERAWAPPIETQARSPKKLHRNVPEIPYATLWYIAIKIEGCFLEGSTNKKGPDAFAPSPAPIPVYVIPHLNKTRVVVILIYRQVSTLNCDADNHSSCFYPE